MSLMKRDHVLLLSGPPFAGKGVNRRRLAETYGVPTLSTGDCCRALESDPDKPTELVELEVQVRGWLAGVLNSGSDDDRIHRAMAIMDTGGLVDDEIVTQFVYGFLKLFGHGVLDGFPRTPTQAVLLDGFLQSQGIGSDNCTMFVLDVNEDVQMERIQAAVNTGSRKRKDDKPETIRKRIREDAEKRYPVEIYFSASNRLRRIPANGTPDEVFGKICAEAAELGIVPWLPPDTMVQESTTRDSLFRVNRGGLLTASAMA